MLRSLLLSDQRAPVWVEGTAAVTGPGPDERLWVDVEAPGPEELAWLRQRFDLHPVALEACMLADQRPKLEEYPSQLFLVLHRLSHDHDEAGVRELHAFLGDRYLITVHADSLADIQAVSQRLVTEPALAARGLVHALYLLCERIATANFEALDYLFEQIEAIEDSVLKQEDKDALPELFAAKRRLARARRLVAPQRDVISLLLEAGPPFIDDRARPYFRRVLEVLLRMAEALDTQREILSNVLDAHLSIVSNRTNAIMKSLTLLSAIFLPLSFVTGFFGQNFTHLPFDNVWLMWLGLGVCAATPLGMVLWFRSRKWL